MSIRAIFLLALGLAMDAVAASIATTPRLRGTHVRRAALLAVAFGGFQALMPLLGYLLGNTIGPLVQRWDHWIAFILLAAIGGKMLVELVRGEPLGERQDGDRRELVLVLTLAVATSIDAFAVGITLPMLGAPLVLSVLTIGVVTAALSGAASFASKRVGTSRPFTAIGGVVLIGLGGKILYEHLQHGI